VAQPGLGKPLPHDDYIERTVLGAILAGHPRALELLDILRPEDFFDSRNKTILSKMREICDAGMQPGLLNLHDELTVSGDIETSGGIAYLAGLGDGIHRGAEVLTGARSLRRMATFRHVIHYAEQVKTLAFEQAGTAERLLDSAIEKLSGLARDLECIEDEGTSYFDASTQKLMELREGARLKIFTDVDTLDQWTAGFREQELVVVTAETGMGKSLFGSQIRNRACRDGFRALFCSGEMTAAHLAGRDLVPAADVQPIKMRRDDLLTDEDFSSLVKAASHQCKRCRILDGELELSRIRRVARKMKTHGGLDLIVLDYDELIEAPGGNEFEQQKSVARFSKSLAVNLTCVVILISQLRKTLSGENAAKPTLQRVYGAGAKQKHASFIILVDRPFVRKLEGDEKAAELKLLKSRDGKTGRIKAKFNVKTLRFEDATEPSEGTLFSTKVAL
jgi:replicative DNA helicase